ncbi:hypothetical protein F4777DRAFT_220032 [Nemania sp. FL0916]|nr:hypothetical protein F4777DRAFT_220032 [Nemania sp. FL0916]
MIMANTLAALKDLPCPAGDNCTAFQCLFGHAREKAEQGNRAGNGAGSTEAPHYQSITAASATSRSRHKESKVDSPELEVPRKRMKLDLDGTSASPQHSTRLVDPPKTLPSEQVQHSSVNVCTAPQEDSSMDLLRPNPPPATKIKGQAGSRQVVTEHPPAATTAQIKSQSSHPRVQSKPAKPAKQPESLNPRLLKKAPASHSSRVALVKALHKEFERLNGELIKTAQDGEKKLLLSDQELIVKTLDEEQEIAITKTSIYNTSIRNKILMYKRMTVSQWREERSKAVQGADAGGTMETPEIETGLTPPQEIEFLPRLVYDLTSLQAHGYVSVIPSDADLEAATAGVKTSGNTEACDRCTRRFQVYPGRRDIDGALSSNGPCVYHPGKTYLSARAPGDRSQGQRRFACCQRSYDDEAGGCTTAQHHVFKTTDPKRLAAILNFVNTPINPEVPKDRAVSFDCEMGYTVHGLELIRLTVVSWPTGDMLLDILVRPVGEVLDLNTRFSGVRPEDMASADPCGVGFDHRPAIVPTDDPARKPELRLKIAPSPKVARELLFTVISADTPLIGHGLENDLNAARIIHPTCIDTVLLWPHSRGLPMRNGLKYLMQSKLGRKIQEDHGEGPPQGHDSAEDARAAGDLVRLKIRDEWKTMRMEGWSVGATGELLAPSEGWTVVGGAKIKGRTGR